MQSLLNVLQRFRVTSTTSVTDFFTWASINEQESVATPTVWYYACVYVLWQWLTLLNSDEKMKGALDKLQGIVNKPDSLPQGNQSQSFDALCSAKNHSPFAPALSHDFNSLFEPNASPGLGTISRVQGAYQYKDLFAKLYVAKATMNFAKAFVSDCFGSTTKLGQCNDDTIRHAYFKKFALALHAIINSHLDVSDTLTRLDDVESSIQIRETANEYFIEWQPGQRIKRISDPISIALYYNSVVKLRAAFALYTFACNVPIAAQKELDRGLRTLVSTCYQAASGDRQCLVDIESAISQTDKSNNNSYQANAFDQNQFMINNRKMLVTSVINASLIDRVFASLPWVANIFSIDNLADAFKTKFNQQWNGYLDVWYNIFFVDASEYPACVKFYKENRSEVADHIIGLDTKYVTDIVCKPKVVNDTNKEYISRYHLCQVFLYVMNHLQSEGALVSQDNLVLEIANYVDAYLRSFDEMTSLARGIRAFSTMITHEEATIFSKSRASVLSYVRFWAAPSALAGAAKSGSVAAMTQRHAVLYDPKEANAGVKRFVVDYASDLSSATDRVIAATREHMAKALQSSSSAAAASSPRVWYEQINMQAYNTASTLRSGQQAEASSVVYDQRFSFGPFTRVFGNQFRDHNDLVAKGSYEVVHALLQGRSTVVMGFGISGAGKTSTLVYLRSSSNKGIDDNNNKQRAGVVLHWLATLREKGYFKGAIWYSAVESHVDYVDQSGNAALRYMLASEQADGRLSSSQQQFTVQDDRVVKWSRITLPSVSAQHAQDAAEFMKTVGQEIISRVEHPTYRQTKPTTNNDSSSRSHVIITFLISKEEPPSGTTDVNAWVKDQLKNPQADKPCFLHVVDLAGVENEFGAGDSDAGGLGLGAASYAQAELDRRQRDSRELFKSPKKQSAFVVDNTLRTELAVLAKERNAASTSADAPVTCSCIERYIFNDLYPYSYYTNDSYGEIQSKLKTPNSQTTMSGGLLEDDSRLAWAVSSGGGGAHPPIAAFRNWYLGVGQKPGVPVIPTLPWGSRSYLHSQLWGSVILNPCATYGANVATNGKLVHRYSVPVPIGRGGTEATQGAVLTRMVRAMDMKRDAMRKARGGFLIGKLAEKGRLNTNGMGAGTRQVLLTYWSEPFRFRNLKKFFADVYPFEKYQIQAVELPRERDNADALAVAFHMILPTFASSSRPSTMGTRRSAPAKVGVRLTNEDEVAVGATVLDVLTQHKVGNWTFYDSANVEPIYLQPRYTPALRVMARASDGYGKLNNMQVQRLHAIRAKIFDDSAVYKVEVAAHDFANALCAFIQGGASPFGSNPAAQKQVAPLLMKLLLASFSDDGAGMNFQNRLRSFINFFRHSSYDEQNRLHAYVHMTYDFIEYAMSFLTHGGALALDGGKIRHSDAQTFPPTLTDTFVCELLLRNAVPMSAYALNYTVDVGASDVPWNADSPAIVTIVTGDKLIKTRASYTVKYRGAARQAHDGNGTANGFTNKDDTHTGSCTVDTVAEHYQLFDSERHSRLFTQLREPTVYDDRVLNLPIGNISPPITGIDSAAAAAGSDAAAYAPAELTAGMLGQICATLKHANAFFQAAGGGIENWIHYLFLFGQLVGCTEQVVPAVEKRVNDFVDDYMKCRTREGKFINNTVNALKKTMLNIVAVSSAKVNPYGNPDLSPINSLFGCHPVLDRSCFNGELAFQLQGQDQICAPNDVIFKHIQKFGALDDVQLAVLAVVNLSRSVQDPPAVPYVNSTTLAHAFKLYNFWRDGTDLHSYVDPAWPVNLRKKDKQQKPGTIDAYPADGWQVSLFFDADEGRFYNPVAMDALYKDNIIYNIREGLKELQANIVRARADTVLHSVVADIKRCMDQLPQLPQASSSTEDAGSGAEDNSTAGSGADIDSWVLQLLEGILIDVQHYNTASLVGNLNFMDSLRKRGVDSIADLKTRNITYPYDIIQPNGQSPGQSTRYNRMFYVDLPALCGAGGASSWTNIANWKTSANELVAKVQTNVETSDQYYTNKHNQQK